MTLDAKLADAVKTWGLEVRAVVVAACIILTLGLLLIPVLSYHSHTQLHGPGEHHASMSADDSRGGPISGLEKSAPLSTAVILPYL